MKPPRNICRLRVAATILVLFISQNASSIGESSPYILRLSPSTRANGMGESLAAVADADLTYFNPAALGIFALNHLGALGWESSSLLENFGLDVPHEYFYANLGMDSRKLDAHYPVNVAAALQYRSQMIDWGQVEGRDENNMPTGSVHTYDRNRALVFALGIEYGIEASLGVGFGFIKSQIADGGSEVALTGRTQDIGLQMRFPLVQMAQKYARWNGLEAIAPFSFEIAPSFGWARLNKGVGRDSALPFPKMDRYGASASAEFSYGNLHLLDFL